jgi:outer membrane protein assembly factor BamB
LLILCLLFGAVVLAAPKPAWQVTLPAEIQSIPAMNETMAVVEGPNTEVAYNSWRVTFYLVRLRDGKVLRTLGLVDPLSGEIALDANTLYVKVRTPAKTVALEAYSLADGTRRWRYDGIAFESRILPADGRVFVAQANGEVAALSVADGSLLWHVQLPGGAYLGAPVPVLLAVIGQRLYLGQQHLALLETSTGKLLGARTITDTESSLYILSPPLLTSAGRVLIFPEADVGMGVENLRLRALHDDLTPAWYRANTGTTVLADEMLVCDDYRKPYEKIGLVGLDPGTGAVRWTRRGAQGRGHMACAWGNTAVAFFGNNLVSLDPRSGHTRWHLPYALHRAAIRTYGPWLVIAAQSYGKRKLSNRTLVGFRVP